MLLTEHVLADLCSLLQALQRLLEIQTAVMAVGYVVQRGGYCYMVCPEQSALYSQCLAVGGECILGIVHHRQTRCFVHQRRGVSRTLLAVSVTNDLHSPFVHLQSLCIIALLEVCRGDVRQQFGVVRCQP